MFSTLMKEYCIYAAYMYFVSNLVYTHSGFLWDLTHFSIVLVMPQIHDPDKLDIFAKESEQAFQWHQIQC